MNPIAFSIFNFDIRWYGIFMALAMLIASIFVLKKGKSMGILEDDLLDLIIWVLPSAVIGARLYYVLFYDLNSYLSNPLEILNLRGGGLAIHGGVIGGVLAGYFVTKKKNMPFIKLADVVAPVLILGQAIGRWGNFFNGEAHGGPTDLPWGIMVDGVKVHPTFLYESIWNFLVFVFLLRLLNKKHFDSQIFSLYLILYSVARFLIEGLRTDSLMVGPFRTAQVISLLMIGLGIFIYQWGKSKALKQDKTI
jgi:phosphatidylglycerol:prolipoprotein diacylglycerol transferase